MTVPEPSAAAATPRRVAARGRRGDTRAQIITRAELWVAQDVPYSQTSWWTNTYGTYRQDCSGYVSMAAKIGAPGQRTVELYDTYSTKIAAKDLRWGDIVVDPVGTGTTRHVVIFDKWADPYKTAYWAYEQRDVHGTSHRVVKYGLSGTDGYFSRKLNNVTG